MTEQELQELLLKEIPSTRYMGLSVVVASDRDVKLEFELGKNRNHKGTAFGGSQYSSCALSCYGLLLVGLRRRGYYTNNIVIANGQIKYKAPVGMDFYTLAVWDDAVRDEFFDKLKRKKKAKVTLRAEVWSGNLMRTAFAGEFVAILD